MADAMERAVEAAAIAYRGTADNWDELSVGSRDNYRDKVRPAIEAAAPILRADERERVLAPVRALHAGTHLCLRGTWYTDDPDYKGTIAHREPCPTLAAIGDPS